MVWENRSAATDGSSCAAAAPRKFYSYATPTDETPSTTSSEKHQLLKYVADSVIGKDSVFETPYGYRKVLYCDYIASGRSLSFIEDHIRSEVLPHYGSTHNTDTNTALQTTMFRHEARDIMRNSVRASERDKVLLTGSGATGAIVRLLHFLKLKQPPIIIAGPYLHHSALLPFREAGATIMRVREDSNGMVDMSHLEHLLQGVAPLPQQVVGCFSGASNITGVLTDSVAVTVMLHRHKALAFWDYATAAPYVKLDMNPLVVGDSEGLAHKDAMFFSVHKFIGGPQTPGVLVVKRSLLRNEVPALPGGGTVFFVSREKHRYLQSEEEREEGGTPSIVEDIRAGLVMQLKDAISPEVIETRHEYLVTRLSEFVTQHPNMVHLGPNFRGPNGEMQRLPILSFLIKHQGLFLHFKYVTALLNDLFGIQARGGCACAGPYALDLLGIEESAADELHRVLAEPSGLNRYELRRTQEHSDSEVIRPGFVRLNLSYTLSNEEVDFVLNTLSWMTEHAWKFLPQYSFNPETGEWKHRKQQVMLKGRQWLGNISYQGGKFSLRETRAVDKAPDFEGCFSKANEFLSNTLKVCRQYPDSSLDSLTLTDTALSLRWFMLPSEARNLLMEPTTKKVLSPCSLLRPVVYPLDDLTLSQRKDCVWKQTARVHYWPPEDSHQKDDSIPLPEISLNLKSDKNPIAKTETNRNNNKSRVSLKDSNASNSKNKMNKSGQLSSPVSESRSEGSSPANGTNGVDVSAKLETRKENGVVCTTDSCFLPRPESDCPVPSVAAKWHSPPKVLFNPVQEAIKQFNMIRDGDRVLVCLSGGKDSLSLLHILHHYQYCARSQGIHYELGAVTVDPESASYDPRPLIPYLKSLGVEYLYEQQAILQQALSLPDLNSICSFCSRMKRGRIYAAARRKNYNVLAFGQHLDDLAESFLMSVMHNGRLRTMKAAYFVQEQDLRVIRPLVFTREKHLRQFAESRALPVIPENCPACFEVPKERHRSKQLLAQQELLFPTVYSSLRTALLPLMNIAHTGMENALLGKLANSSKEDDALLGKLANLAKLEEDET